MSIQGRRSDDQDDPLLIRIGEAARLLGISERHVWELVLRGIIPVTRLGRRTLVRRSDLEVVAAGKQSSGPDSETRP